MNVREAKRRYLVARRAELARASRIHFAGTLDGFARSVGPDRLVERVQRRHVEAWLSDLELSRTTVRNRLSTVRGSSR
jgi:hypothetical protein